MIPRRIIISDSIHALQIQICYKKEENQSVRLLHIKYLEQSQNQALLSNHIGEEILLLCVRDKTQL